MQSELPQLQRNQILQGDCRQLLKGLPSESVDSLVTSPPYLWLRNYGIDGQIGLESSMYEYLDTMWALFDEVKRVLKSTGTVWVNLGDTYSGMKIGNTNNAQKEGINEMKLVKPRSHQVKDKSLMGIPDRFKIGMIDRGWICRNEIIWWKRNAMPSSAKDRFTVDYEKVFFFTKSPKYYFETQYEPYAPDSLRLSKIGTGKGKHEAGINAGFTPKATEAYREKMKSRMPPIGGKKKAGGDNPTYSGNTPEWGTAGRLKRTVWDITTQAFSEAHFATYPEELVTTCLKAGCPEYVCVKCGKPREPIWEATEEYKQLLGKGWHDHSDDAEQGQMQEKSIPSVQVEQYRKTGLSDCGCGAGFQPGIVLDPFFGSGTTGLAAMKIARDWIGCELNPEYIEIAKKRLGPLLTQTRLI